MASAAQSAQNDHARRMSGMIMTLVNDRLRFILRSEGLPVSGVKTELQRRIIDHINRTVATGDGPGITRLYNLLKAPRYDYSSSAATSSSPTSVSPNYHNPNFGRPYPSAPQMPSHHPQVPARVQFKESPFYRVIKPLTQVVECKVRENTRDNVKVEINLTPEVSTQLQDDQNMRIMVFCAAESQHSPMSQSDIAFPHQVELKCNGDEVKANLRGLKNKPGSTRPADITNLVRKKAGYANHLVMTYALTQKGASQKFYLVVMLAQRRLVEDLVAKLKASKFISKERVIQEMNNKAQDTDIVATSAVMSLKCPISTLRIAVPCRSMGCPHNQCFDATSYLQLQEQAPTWTCPVCNKAAPFENLTVDQYVDNILKSTSSSVEQVTIEPNGVWSKNVGPDDLLQNGNPTPDHHDDDDDDDDKDLIEVQGSRLASLKQDIQRADSHVQTPPLSSRDSPSSLAPRSSNKRLASEVIDLTLSDDEAPAAKIKRPSISSADSARARFHDGIPFSFHVPSPAQYNGDYYNTRL